MNQLIEWFELEELAKTEMDLAGSTSDKVYEILKTVDVKRRREIIQHLINEEAPLRIDVL
ncbi:hypothetical protein [Natrinema versiforme]|uniref:hypothetical protein n=1 Tax=Natrinema versiforme TaxID=88724 RepID=UPI000AC9BFDA|nr:hypothetical protein [Natrinema versiforme]